MREKWASANSNHARLAPLVSLALVRFAHENAVTATREPSLRKTKVGKSGPARIRIAVTATRRPKDTKLPHRPASRQKWVGSLILPDYADRPSRIALPDAESRPTRRATSPGRTRRARRRPSRCASPVRQRGRDTRTPTGTAPRPTARRGAPP